MMDHIAIAVIIFAAWNLLVFAVYGVDKSKAKRGKQRISESALLLSAAFFGGIGALLGMRLFRHKTKHMKFKIGVPILLTLQIIIAVICIYLQVFQNG